jgi:S-methylmethionine-dependent homocysteine/selenocysteine methylase
MVTIVDGGMGSELEARGVPMDHEAWCGLANLEAPDLVRQIHEEYIAAGADVVITNTFPTNRRVLEAAGVGDRFEDANRAAVQAALDAREHAGRPVAVAGSMSLWAGHGEWSGSEAAPAPEVLEVYGEQAALLADAGVDLLVLEMLDARWAPAVRAALATGLPVWAGVWTRGFDAGGQLTAPTGRPFEEDLPLLIDDGLEAVVVMHAPIDAVPAALAAIERHWDGRTGAYPHSGHFERPHWVFKDVAPSALADAAESWVRDGAEIAGGCCGTRPAHIRAISDRLATRRAEA